MRLKPWVVATWPLVDQVRENEKLVNRYEV